jgi:hypothetical protein
MDNKFGDHESIMHVIADKLVEHFEGVGAVNYIEQIFTDKNDPCKSFVLTMQMVNGLTPCEKLNAANELIAKQAEQINIMRHALTEIKNTPSVRHDECSWMASVALEATKEQA